MHAEKSAQIYVFKCVGSRLPLMLIIIFAMHMLLLTFTFVSHKISTYTYDVYIRKIYALTMMVESISRHGSNLVPRAELHLQQLIHEQKDTCTNKWGGAARGA